MSELHVTSSLAGTSWLCLPRGLKGLLRQDLGKRSQTGALPRLQVSQLGGLDWEEGVVSQDFPQGGWPFLVLAAPLRATPPNPRRLWVQQGQGQWEESLIPQQNGSGCQTLAQD